ncbi:MAG: LPS assembly protein LptD [Alphaproteobacteria bacterium]
MFSWPLSNPEGTVLRAMLVAALASLACLQPIASPAQVSGNNPVQNEDAILFQADNLSYDQNSDTIIAEGHVEAAYGKRLLFANSVNYNQTTGIVIASGDVVLTDPDGSTLFADQAQLSSDLRDGVVRGIGLRMADNSAMAAASATRKGENLTYLNRAVYSPCKLCPEKGKTIPAWQLRARKVTHNKQTKRITYNHAFLDAFGVPVLYTPYFSHADPSVKRESGFLPPNLGSSSDLGRKIEVPYYWSLSPSRDLTLSPLVTSREGTVMKALYEERSRRGRFEFEGSLTRVDERDGNNIKTGSKQTRGHIFSRGRFAVSPNDIVGFDIERATDDTFLSRYNLTNIDTLTTRLFTDHNSGRDLGTVDFLLFQGLNQDDDPGLTPMILPLLHYSGKTDPDAAGGRFGFDADALVLRRRDGQDSQRISLDGGWQRNYISGLGEVYSIFANLRGDAYYIDDIAVRNDKNDLTGRILPQAGVEWRLPLANRMDVFTQIVEPIVQVIASPYGGNPDDIPNEDSGSFEFDSTNLFSPTRFPGRDRWEGGPRANVGMKWGAYRDDGGYVSVLFGQVWRVKDDSTFAADTGLDNERSDYVGSIALSPSPWFEVLHRFRLDREDLGYRRSEVDLNAGPSRLRLGIGYVRLARELSNAALTSREEIAGALRAQFDANWWLSASSRRELGQNSTVATNAGIFYQDECMIFGFIYDRRYTRDRDVQPSSSINFKISLLNLG